MTDEQREAFERYRDTLSAQRSVEIQLRETERELERVTAVLNKRYEEHREAVAYTKEALARLNESVS